LALFSGKIISENSLKEMTSFTNDYGLGLFEIPFYNKKGWGHTGGIDGFSSIWAYFPNENVSVALTSNGTNYSNNNIVIAALSAVFNQEFEIPEFASSNADVAPGYHGTFSNSQIGLDIQITENEGQYIAQATGQFPFPLEKVDEFTFKFDLGGIQLKFSEDLKSFMLLQGGGEFLFEKIK